MVTQVIRIKPPDAERLELSEQLRHLSGSRGLRGSARLGNELRQISPQPTRREEIIAAIPSVADLDLIVVDPPAEWLADKGWK